MKQPRLYLALDDATPRGVWEKVRQVNDVEGDFGFKLNLDVLGLHGARAITNELREQSGRAVFTDFKTWNGGRTMADLAVGLAAAGSSLFNMYAHAGVKFMQRVVDAVGSSKHEMDVYGLGVLTHYTDADCRLLYRRSLNSSVRLFGEWSAQAGLAGYIQPGTCLKATSKLGIKRLVPAVRPLWFPDTKANEQEQTVTPEEAFGGGADIVVCGSPVFKSPDPAEALYKLLQAISGR